MQRVERRILVGNKEIDHICFLSKNLYNSANFMVRQEFIYNRLWVRYQDLTSAFKDSELYKCLPAQTSQQVLRLLDKNWISFFRNVKQYKTNRSPGRPKLPGYKNKDGKNITIFTNQQAKIKEGYIYFPKKANLSPIKTKVTSLNQVRIVPQATCYVLEVVYTKEAINVPVKEGTYLSIDIGLNNLAACTNNVGKQPFVINGRPLKSINQYFNKMKAHFQSFVKNKFSNRLSRLTLKRNNKVSDYLHKCSRFIINYCIGNQISEIVVGKNDKWKQKISLGKRTNQNFVSIPFAEFIKQLEYKAEEYGIKVTTTEESHTSKCSFLDLESVEHHEKYAGKRIKRGLFRSALGKLINADVQGSYNILRKEVPKIDWKQFVDGIEGVGLHPVIVNISQ